MTGTRHAKTGWMLKADDLTMVNEGEYTGRVLSVAIPASEDRFIGPFPLTAFGAAPAITYSAVTSVTVAVIEVPA